MTRSVKREIACCLCGVWNDHPDRRYLVDLGVYGRHAERLGLCDVCIEECANRVSECLSVPPAIRARALTALLHPDPPTPKMELGDLYTGAEP